jgi:LacI family transcriptional regulator
MVLRDEERILELGVQHLLRCGYDHLVFVSVHEDYFSRVRGQSFRDLLQRLGVAGGLLRIPGQDQPQATALACLREALGPVQGRIGLIAAQDGIAAQVLDLVLALQWTVPGQVGILGIDNDPLVCDFQAVSLSSIDNDRAGVGRAAARRLADRMRGVPPGCRVLVPPVGVVSRASTATGPHATGAGAGAGEPSLVDQARQVMEHHLADSGLSVDLVARSLGRSRRGLHDAFQRELGTSVGAEIARMRIALAQTLLKSTALPQAEIARRCGYSSAEALARLLRRELGQAPGRLRGKITPPA